MVSHFSNSWAVVMTCLLALGGAGCDCGARTARLFPAVQLVDASGAPLSSFDFGKVQVSTTSLKSVRIRNAGAVPLVVDSVAIDRALFAAPGPLPISVSPSQEQELPLSFTPVIADQPETATVTVHSNDPERPTVTFTVSGLGVASAAVVEPTALDFGEVYLGEMKELSLTLTNAGSSGLVVSAAYFSAAVPPSITSELAPLVKTIAEGETVTVSVRFTPVAMGDVTGAIELGLPTGLLSIPISGRGIQAQPKLCFQFEDSPFEQCSDGISSTNLDVRFGSLCDRRVYPVDGGFGCSLDGGAVVSARSGRFYVRNDGNTPVSYTMNIVAGQTTRCDGASTIDFQFANAPTLADGGSQASWPVPLTQLPANVNDAKPWETTPVAITYVARSRCRDDGADLATVVWTRQNEPGGTSRRPGSLLATLTGASILSSPVPFPVTFTGNAVVPQEVALVSNTGDGPVALRAVELWQSNDGGATPHVRCRDAVGGSCQYFSWVSGPTLPVRLEGTTVPGDRVSHVVGRLAYGVQDGGLYYPPAQEQRVFAVVETSDPYTPTVTVPIVGRLH